MSFILYTLRGGYSGENHVTAMLDWNSGKKSQDIFKGEDRRRGAKREGKKAEKE